MVNIRLEKIYPEGIVIWDEKKDRFRPVVVDGNLSYNLTEYIVNNYDALHGVRKRDQKLFNFSARTLNRKVIRAFEILRFRNVKPRWHTFRHTYVRLMLDSMGDRGIQFICEQTGDSPVTILKYYGVPSVDERIRASNEFFDYLKGLSPAPNNIK